jgi:hypothetical protein
MQNGSVRGVRGRGGRKRAWQGGFEWEGSTYVDATPCVLQQTLLLKQHVGKIEHLIEIIVMIMAMVLRKELPLSTSASCLAALASMQYWLSSRFTSCLILRSSSCSDACSESNRCCSALSFVTASASNCLLPSASSNFTWRHVINRMQHQHQQHVIALIMLTTSAHSCSAPSSVCRLVCRLRPMAIARASSRSAFSNLQHRAAALVTSKARQSAKRWLTFHQQQPHP